MWINSTVPPSRNFFTFSFPCCLLFIPISCVSWPVLFKLYGFHTLPFSNGGSPAVKLGASRWSQINSFLILHHSKYSTAFLFDSKENWRDGGWKNLHAFYVLNSTIGIRRENLMAARKFKNAPTVD